MPFFAGLCARSLIITGFQVLTVYDLNPEEALGACRRMRHYVSLSRTSRGYLDSGYISPGRAIIVP